MLSARLPEFVRQNYEAHEWKHASAILVQDFPDEWRDVMEMLSTFRLRRSWIATPGGSKSQVSASIDRFLYARGWQGRRGFECRGTTISTRAPDVGRLGRAHGRP